MPLQIRRGTDAERQNMSVPLASGELLYVTDDKRLFVGDGQTLGGVPVTGFTSEDAVDAAGNALSAGQHQNISFIYGQTQDLANRIDAVIDLSTYSGEISADGFRGSVFAENSTLIVDSVNASINLDGTIKGNLIPDQNEVYDIGSNTNRFKDLYLSGSSLWLGDAQLTSVGTSIDLPAGSTINGIPLSGGGGGIIDPITGDINANIIGDDSTIIVNVSTKQIIAEGGFVGNLVGDVKGSIFADNSSIIIDGISGNITGNNITGGNITGGNITGNNITGNVLSNGTLSLSNTILFSNSRDIAFESAGGLFRYACIGSQPDLDEGLGDSIVAAVDSFTGIDLNAAPPDLSSSFVAGDITSTIKFVSDDTTRAYRSVVLGAQIDKTAFTESYAPSKFFLMVFPDEDREVEEGQAVEDVIRYVTYDPYGRFGVGREDAKATLDINGFMKLKVLPAEPTVVEDASIPDGFVAIADGVNWDPLSNGKQSMVVRLGGSWVQMAVAP
jgi:hypothetical protein